MLPATAMFEDLQYGDSLKLANSGSSLKHLFSHDI